MATKFWVGRKCWLTIANGASSSDILDLGGDAVKSASGVALTAGSTTTSIVTTQFSPNPVDNFHVGKFVMFDYATSTASLRGEQRLITASTAAGVVTITPALPTAPLTGDTFGTYDLSGAKSYRRWDIVVCTPATVTTPPALVKISDLETGTYYTLQSGGADIGLGTGNKAISLVPVVARFLQITGAAQGQVTNFLLMGSTIGDSR